MENTATISENMVGRLQGLEEAAQILEMAAGTSKQVHFLHSRKKATAMMLNETLLREVAKTIREYASKISDGLDGK